MNDFRFDYSERDTERRYELLKGCGWKIEVARDLWSWVQSGMTPHELRMFVASKAVNIRQEEKT